MQLTTRYTRKLLVKQMSETTKRKALHELRCADIKIEARFVSRYCEVLLMRNF